MARLPAEEGFEAPSEDTLEARIVSVFEDLTKKQQRLARFMLENELFVAFASTEELGRSVGVDAATVVRFSRLLGYEGFADLRDGVRRRLPQFLTAVEKVSRSLNQADRPDDMRELIFSQDVTNIEETARRNPPEMFTAATSAIQRAARVYVLGLGLSTHVAGYLAHQLALIGVPAHRASRGLVEAAIDLASVTRDDVVIAVSLWRYLKDTARLFDLAARAGATTIAIADSRVSPVARRANISLVAATETAELSHSVTALVTLANVLVTEIALSNPERTLERLKSVDDFYDRFDLMSE